jgi:hypothetical protein
LLADPCEAAHPCICLTRSVAAEMWNTHSADLCSLREKLMIPGMLFHMLFTKDYKVRHSGKKADER